MSFHVPEKNREKNGLLGSDETYGNNGLFWISTKKPRAGLTASPLKVIASDGAGWEHVSVSLPNRCPEWGEMCRIKRIFWDEEDAVIQIHPPKSEYVDNHPYCLHLWRKAGDNSFFERPHWLLVGPR